ncbi:Ribokinase-like protein [Xylariaceae sp. FL1019]|nr:Ribokinase-like protein [Xylariaceae sp. FL1019]
MARNLVCIGACYLDTILSVSYYPGEDEKLRAAKRHVRRGGNCPNLLQVFQQLLRSGQDVDEDDRDINLYLVTCLPSRDAPATSTITNSFGRNTLVDISKSIFRDGSWEAASCYIIRSEANGSRTSVNYNDLPDMTFDEFVNAVQDMTGDTWFHFEGRIPTTTLQCIQWLRHSKPNAKVSVEIEKAGRTGLEELAGAADVVFYSRSWAESKAYESAEECLRGQSAPARNPQVAPAQHHLCTWGSDGASLSTPSGNILVCPASRPGQVIRVIDTIGAGDTFIAGSLFGFLCHEDWGDQARLDFAVGLATRKVQQEGFEGLGV